MEKPLDGLHIIVDAGNGAGGFFVEQILQPLEQIQPAVSFGAGWDVPESYTESEDATAISAMVEAVLQQKADFGDYL